MPFIPTQVTINVVIDEKGELEVYIENADHLTFQEAKTEIEKIKKLLDVPSVNWKGKDVEHHRHPPQLALKATHKH